MYTDILLGTIIFGLFAVVVGAILNFILASVAGKYSLIKQSHCEYTKLFMVGCLMWIFSYFMSKHM